MVVNLFHYIHFTQCPPKEKFIKFSDVMRKLNLNFIQTRVINENIIPRQLSRSTNIKKRIRDFSVQIKRRNFKKSHAKYIERHYSLKIYFKSFHLNETLRLNIN